MRFLVDENVHIKLMAFLRDLEHDVQRVQPGSKNGEVVVQAKQEQRILITRDRGFSDTLTYPPKELPGIICLRIHPPLFEKLSNALASLLKSVPSENFSGKLFVVEETGYHEFS